MSGRVFDGLAGASGTDDGDRVARGRGGCGRPGHDRAHVAGNGEIDDSGGCSITISGRRPNMWSQFADVAYIIPAHDACRRAAR